MKLNYFASIALALGLASCSNEGVKVPVPSPGKAELSFNVEVPAPTVVSRAYNDMSVENIDGLVFDENGKFIEVLRAGSVTLTDEGLLKINFLMDTVSKKRTFQLIANARIPGTTTYRVDFSSLVPGTSTEANVASLISNPIDQTKTYESETTPVFMWSKFILPTGIKGNMTLPGDPIKLLRSVACVQVIENETATAENRLDEFEILGMAVLGVPDRCYPTPASVTTAASANPTAARPVADATMINEVTDNSWIEGAAPTAYIYERTCSTSSYATVIIHAIFDGHEGYYKIVLADNSNVPYNIIRNHRYILRVDAVHGPGYSDLATAVAGKPSNALSVQIVDSDFDYPNTSSDANFFMRADATHVRIYGSNNDGATYNSQEITICKIIADRGIVPTITNEAQWLVDLSANSIGSNTFEIRGKLNGSSTDVRNTVLTFRCDNLLLDVNVEWNPIISDSSDDDSYCLKLNRDDEINWWFRIQSPASRDIIALHNTNSSVAAFPGLSGALDDLNCRFNSTCYCHVAKGSGQIPVVTLSAGKTDGTPIAAKYIFIP